MSRFGNKILTTAFVTGQGGPHPKDIDIRCESYEVRSALKGNLVPVFSWNTHIDDVSEPLLKATSVCARNLIQNGTITLPDTVLPRDVSLLLDYMKDLTKASKTFTLQLKYDDDNMTTALGICHAAEVLGMAKYVSHIIRKLDAIFHGLPSYDELEALVIHRAGKTRFYKIAVQNFAQKVRDGEIPDQQDFDAYLELRTGFKQDIAEANAKHENWAAAQAKREQREQRVQQRVEREETAKLKAADLAKQTEERVAREKQFWGVKKADDIKMRKATEVKLRASGNARKFTPEERTWYVRNQGKQPPKGC